MNDAGAQQSIGLVIERSSPLSNGGAANIPRRTFHPNLMRMVSRSLVAGLTVLVALTQTGCLTHYMWESRLVTAGEYREGRVKFEGDLREAKFNAEGDLALLGKMTEVHGGEETRTIGVLIAPKHHLRDLSFMCGWRFSNEDYHIDLQGPKPSYDLSSHDYRKEERETLATFLFMPGEMPSEYATSARLFEKNSSTDKEPMPSLSGETGLTIEMDCVRYPALSTCADTTAKTVLTLPAVAVDIASPFILIPVYVIGVPIAIATGNYGPKFTPDENAIGASDLETQLSSKKHTLRGRPVFLRPTLSPPPSQLPSGEN